MNLEVGLLVRFNRRNDQKESWLGLVIEIRPDHHFQVMWCDDPSIIGTARCDDERFEVVA